MIISIVFVIVSVLVLYELRKKNILKNTLFAIILLNIIYLIFIHLLREDIFKYKSNCAIGIGILSITNAVLLIFSSKLSKDRKALIISCVIYFIIMCIAPVYKEMGHEHHFYDDTSENATEKGLFATNYKEEIKEFIQYYNIYGLYSFKIYTK